jgi:hypothetical protein
MHRRLLPLLLLLPGALHSQAAPRPPLLPEGPALGGSLEIVGAEGVRSPFVSLRLTELVQNRFSREVSLGVLPEGLREGVLVLLLDAGPVYNAALPNTTVLLKGGVSMVGIMSGGGGGAALGLHLGIGGITRIGPTTGLRLDLSQRFFGLPGDLSVGVLGAGIGLTRLPRAR